MYVDTSSYLNNMQTTTNEDSSPDSMGKDDFLKLLVAQLEHQDPFNPTDEKEMISQLAQFSSLEQLTNVNTTLESVLTVLNNQSATSAVSYIGKTVLAAGYELVKKDDSVSEAQFTLDSKAYGVTAHIYDADGQLIASTTIGDLSAGDHSFTWDGKDFNGNEVDDGTYIIALSAYSDAACNTAITIPTNVSGEVSGVSVTDGVVTLNLKDGRSVNLLNVIKITSAAN
jgi:flagellar basal-body rod modification protein FlgD